jgi:hypothetical protein
MRVVAKRRGTTHVVFESVDHFRVVEGVSVRGATEKDVLEDPESGHRYIAKLGGRNNDLEVTTEYAIHLVGRSLGVSVADARIARYHGRLRFLSRYFLDTKAPEELVHGMQLFRELYDENTVTRVLGHQLREQAMFSVQAVKAAFGAHYLQYGADIEDRLFSGFVSMLTHDALIGVQDRHHENWGVIVRLEVGGPPPRFAPLYDSARGLFGNQTDAQLAQHYTGREGLQRLDGFVARSRPLIGFDGPAHRATRLHRARSTPRRRLPHLSEAAATDHLHSRDVRLTARACRFDYGTRGLVQSTAHHSHPCLPPSTAARTTPGHLWGWELN